MAISHEKKVELLKEYKEILKNNEGYFLVNSDSIDTATITELKKELKQTDSNYTVVKNTIFKIALQDTNQPVEIQDFIGSTAVIYFEQDPTAPAKLVREIQKETELLNARSGVYKGKFLSEEQIIQLSEIPSKDELLSMLVGTMSAPLTGFMNAIIGNVRSLTVALKGISQKDS
ncbi:TPA: 50S ribosomal protein L10 [Patescibacteria group bacterium]|nr:50S ribosomal protein L10 [Patescibacteria group bacterium]